MKNYLITAWLLFATISYSFANDILIPFGITNSSAPEWKYRGGGLNLDATNWKDLSYPASDWVTAKTAIGVGTNPPARNTNMPEDASVGGAGISGAKYPTIYFRKILSNLNPNDYSSFQLRTKFDDAIVVWINGVEAFRNNISANPVYATLANGAITNNGSDIYTATISASMFVAGDNVIAVEIHQNSLTSSDLFFDLELTGITNETLIDFGGNSASAPDWKYKGGGINLDATNWKDLSYPASDWLSAKSAFGFGSNPPARNTNIPEDASAGGGGVSGLRYSTLYFRKIISVNSPNTFETFRLRTKFDDGIVVWVNGTEAYRNNIAASPSYATLAPSAIANNGYDTYTTSLSPSLFVNGNNIIAVEIHQNAVTSSDLFFDLELAALKKPTLTRGPYLQMGGKDSITIRWRTDAATISKVKWGTSVGVYTDSIVDNTSTTEHIIRIGTLLPDTRYYYSIGGNNFVLQDGVDNRFTTLPNTDAKRKLRFLALGDCGTNSSNQYNVKNTFLNYIGNNDVDAMILLGDNAYNNGTDSEYQSNFFDVYKDDLLKFYKLYPAPGNHEYESNSANTGRRDLAYHNVFTMPMKGELGGVPSGVNTYYSFDVGDVHFVSLDSYGKEDANTTKMYDTSGAQATWLKNDLAANTKKWTVVYFHHPPYTKTSHNSDSEQDLVVIRERFVQILERYGVDLVLCGHSHGYERSYLLKGYYNNFANPIYDPDFNFLNHTATKSNQNAKYDGTENSCAYVYNSGKYAHGSVYVVSGSAGKLDNISTSGYPHDAMYFSNIANGGSFYFEVDSNRLDGKFISYNSSSPTQPIVRDAFTIFKDVNKLNYITVLKDTPITLKASWKGTYNWPTNGNVVLPEISPATDLGGNYVYVVRDDYNCIKDSFFVTVVSPDVKLCGPVSNATVMSNVSGTNYQWQVNNGSGYTNVVNDANTSGANNRILQLGNIPSSYTGNTYRCLVDGNVLSIVFELRFINRWIGLVNNAWENPGNWSCGVLPDENTDVVINSGTVFLSSNASVRSIQVSSGASFTVNDNYKLQTK